MSTLPFLRRIALAALLGCGWASQPVLAQVQYANMPVATAGIVSNAARAADGDLATSAVIKPTALLGYTSLQVAFPQVASANKPAGLYIRPNNLVTLGALGGATVNTYLQTASGTTRMESYTLSNNVLHLDVQANGLTQVAFTPTKAFNQIELVFFSAAALGEDIAFYEAYSTVSPLPVQLTSFRAKASAAGVALTWETASELNSAHFVVERATGSAKEFRALGQVLSAGSSTQAHHYQFVDAAPAAASYYRLRQVDYDGTEAFSPVVVVQAGAAALRLSTYPNPATETLTLTGPAGGHLQLFDQLGRQVLSADLPATQQQQQLDISGLPSGTYIVRDAATGASTRFVKANAQ